MIAPSSDPNTLENEISSQFRNMTVQLQQLRQQLINYERWASNNTYTSSSGNPYTSSSGNPHTSSPPPLPTQQLMQIQSQFTEIQQEIKQNLPDHSKLNHKFKSLREEFDEIRQGFRGIERRREQDAKRREMLFQGSTRGDDSEPVKRHEELISQHLSVDRSLSIMEQVRDTGTDILGMLSEQNESIERAKRALLDMGVTLGLSQSTLRAIERRLSTDRILVCSGMIFVTILLFLLWWWYF